MQHWMHRLDWFLKNKLFSHSFFSLSKFHAICYLEYKILWKLPSFMWVVNFVKTSCLTPAGNRHINSTFDLFLSQWATPELLQVIPTLSGHLVEFFSCTLQRYWRNTFVYSVHFLWLLSWKYESLLLKYLQKCNKWFCYMVKTFLPVSFIYLHFTYMSLGKSFLKSSNWGRKNINALMRAPYKILT